MDIYIIARIYSVPLHYLLCAFLAQVVPEVDRLLQFYFRVSMLSLIIDFSKSSIIEI